MPLSILYIEALSFRCASALETALSLAPGLVFMSVAISRLIDVLFGEIIASPRQMRGLLAYAGFVPQKWVVY
jgi:hypothetical protein